MARSATVDLDEKAQELGITPGNTESLDVFIRRAPHRGVEHPRRHVDRLLQLDGPPLRRPGAPAAALS